MTSSSIVCASKDQVGCDVGGEAVMLQMNTGVYYGVNAVGARVWALIQHETSVGRVCEAICREYDVTPEQCARDVATVIERFAGAGLAEVRDGAAS